MRKSALMRCLLALGSLSMASSLAGAAGVSAQHLGAGLRVAVVGVPHVVPVVMEARCAEGLALAGRRPTVPDAPFRALRLADGRILAFAEDSTNARFVTSNFGSIEEVSCQSLLDWPKQRVDSVLSGAGWIVSPYTVNGNDIFALVHVEFHGWKELKACRERAALQRRAVNSVCVYDNLSGVWSSDHGASFKPVVGSGTIVARFPYNFRVGMNLVGIRDPTNIAWDPEDRKFYFLAWADRYRRQPDGECLFRNSRLASNGWRAWNGRGFVVKMNSLVVRGPLRQICRPVTNTFLSSLVYSQPRHLFLGVGMGPKGVMFASSSNLTSWSRASLLMRGVRPGEWRVSHSRQMPSAYYSIVDPRSVSRSYDVIGVNPYLYYVVYGVGINRVKWWNRTLMRVRLSVR